MGDLKIDSLRFYPISFSLERAVRLGEQELRRREGFLLQVTSSEGEVGFGEASPLPGVSRETLGKVGHQLQHLQAELPGDRVRSGSGEIFAWLFRRWGDGLLASSLKFALESAIISLAAKRGGLGLAEFLAGEVPRPFLTSAFLSGDVRETMAQALFYKQRGIQTFCLAVGDRNIPLAVRRIEALREILGPSALLRLDARGCWGIEEALLFAGSVGKNQIEHILTPCREPKEWEIFARRSDIPVAARAGWPGFSIEDCDLFFGLETVVVSPGVEDGVTGALNVMARAREQGKKVVVEGAFESGVGTTMLAALAAGGGGTSDLGSFFWIKDRLLNEAPVLDSGMIFPRNLSVSSEGLSAAVRQRLHAV